MDSDSNKENMIEFLTGQKYATVTFTSRKHINRIKRIYENRKEEFNYFHENEDGSIVAKVPLKWIKVNPGSVMSPEKPKRILSEEHKQKLLSARSASLQMKKAHV